MPPTDTQTGKRKQLTDFEIEEIQSKYRTRVVALYSTKNFTVRALAKTYQCHPNTIMRHVAYMIEEIDINKIDRG